MKNPFKAIRIFYSEMIGELRKASWPTWSELVDSTMIVLVAIFILGVLTGIADFCFVNLVKFCSDKVG